MRCLIITLLVLTQSINVFANNVVETTLAEYAWQKRQLVIFTPAANTPEYLKTLSVLESNTLGLQDRKLQSWHVIANQTVSLNNQIRNEFTNEAIRSLFDAPINQFQIVLIGYDQQEKMRQTQINIERLFSIIDQMPMRIQEMQNN